MSNENANQIIEVLKEIVSALHREMGTKWCGDTIERLENLQHKIDFEEQLKNE